MQSTARTASTRVLVQNALRRYNAGNNTEQNWVSATNDILAIFQGGQQIALMLQARVYPKNDTGLAGDKPVIEATGTDISGAIPLPRLNPDGSPAYLGEGELGFPSNLYPNFTFSDRPVNDTYNTTVASFDGRTYDQDGMILLGPWETNSSFSLLSITMPVINNTSHVDILGWMTVVLDGRLLYDVVNAKEGLDESGVTMIVGPDDFANKFEASPQLTDPDDLYVRFVLPPTVREAAPSDRHQQHQFGGPRPLLNYNDFPAVREALTGDSTAVNGAGSLISTTSEEGDSVAVGYAKPPSPMVDWVVLVEQTHGEVWAPINHLRNILLACVFGTLGALLLVIFPIAHYSSRPIHRLREATRKSVAPPGFAPDEDLSDDSRRGEDDAEAALARKEGFFGLVKKITRRGLRDHGERRDEERRRQFRIPGKVKDRKHFIHDELTDLTQTFNDMSDELMMQYEKLEERVQQRTAELELSKKAAEAANESKTLFIANISHELKTPLNGILGMCAVCMSEEDTAKIKRSLGIIYRSGDLLLNLLTDLLTFR